AGAFLTINGKLTNNGKVEVNKGDVAINQAFINNGALLAVVGDLIIEGSVSGSGSATIDFGGQLEFGSGVTGITQNVTFANVGTGTARLFLDATASANPTLIYDGIISGFSSPNDRIDFTGLSFAGNANPTKALVNGNTVLTI